jgi:acetate kinase
MDKAVLVLNAGSSSIKFGIFTIAEDGYTLKPGYRGQIADIGQRAHFVVARTHHNAVEKGVDEKLVDEKCSLADHEAALQALLAWFQQHVSCLHIIAVGHRVVHGGTVFSTPVSVDAEVLAKLEALVPLAPLHQPHNLAAIKAYNRIDAEVLQVACFDTAFHRSMPAVAQSFALPRILTAEGIRPYGFHGLSYEYIAGVLPDDEKSGADGRVIVAHLGHGASLCAMVGRRSVATTMTFTPLDGLPMATRCGSIDPGVLLYLMTEKGLTPDAVADLLQNKSGLLGISGVSGDMRALLVSGEAHAAEAVELFVYRVVREIGSLAAAAGGLDMLVFTGGIGEHSSIIRERICQPLSWLGVQIDSSANAAGNAQISRQDSPVSAWAIPADEELVIAQHAYAMAQAITRRN